MKKDYTHIGILIDRSGSMVSIKEPMEGALLEFINSQALLPGICTVSISQFDTYYESVAKFEPIEAIKEIKIEPRGMTALYDASAKFILETESVLETFPEEEKPEKLLIVIITDGEENSSIEFNANLVKNMIEKHTAKGWEFTYLGTNQDAFTEGAKFGNTADKILNYSPNSAGIKKGFFTLNAATTSYRSGVSNFSYLEENE